MNAILFVTAGVALLTMPGPTNALLAASAAAVGARRSLVLLVAVLAGYAASVSILRGLVGPVAAAVPAFGIGLHLAIALYLLVLAMRLWRVSHVNAVAAAAGFGSVFVTTLLNPKGLVIAFGLLPAAAEPAALAPRLAALAAMIVLSGGLWIALGAALRQGMRDTLSMRLLCRACAATMAAFAGLILSQALSLA